MKIKNLITFSLVSLLMITMFSCGNKKTNVSRTTGWRYNDKNGTGFEVRKDVKAKIPDGMVMIEGGSYTIGEKNEFVTAPRNNPRRRITVSSFYMDQYEIRTVDWREYTYWMNMVFGKIAPDLVVKAEPNKETWREELAYNEPYLANYFTHPAYDEYPVVGITWEQAMDYCSWRTDRVNERALIEAGIIAEPDFRSLENQTDFNEVINNFVFNTQKYLLQNSYQPASGKNSKTDIFGQTRKVDMSDGLFVSDFRLPTEAEWEYAAYGLVASNDGFIPEGRIYPWSGSQVRNPTKKQLGQMQANFVRGRGDMMGTAGNLNDGATVTAPVDWYYPNDFGLYNMAGNVNEWVLDVYRPTTFEDVAEYNSYRGNVYMQPVVSGTDEYGRSAYAIDSLGRIKTEPVLDGDVRNFKDGDAPSQIFTDYALENYFEGMDKLQEMENVKVDITDVLAPRITDNTRVYKGGSWKDRAYWLNPSTRRFLDQDKSANDIGFRCAMSMIGDVNPNARK